MQKKLSRRRWPRPTRSSMLKVNVQRILMLLEPWGKRDWILEIEQILQSRRSGRCLRYEGRLERQRAKRFAVHRKNFIKVGAKMAPRRNLQINRAKNIDAARALGQEQLRIE